MNRQILFLFIVTTLFQTAFSNAQTLVLRSLESVDAKGIKFDEHALVTATDRKINWDHILSGSVAQEQQAQFDRTLLEIGTPLFRLRHRLLIGDYASVDAPAKALQAKFADVEASKKNCRTKFLVQMATYFGQIEYGRRERATIALIELSQLLKDFPELENERLPKDLTNGEVEQCFSPSLLPIWFNQENASTVYEKIQKSFQTNEETDWLRISDGGLVYLTSLGIAAQNETANECLDELQRRSSTICVTWLRLLLAYDEVVRQQPGNSIASLAKEVVELKGSERAVAQYLLGLSLGSLNNRHDKGILELLYIPAVFGDQFQQLSSAALFQAAEFAHQSGNHAESSSLQNKLKNRYPNTHHAKLLQSK